MTTKHTCLRWIYLHGADLRGAYLNGADLRGAYLNGADLREVHAHDWLKETATEPSNCKEDTRHD